MADKNLREFSAPTIANIHTGPIVNFEDNGFELKPALINMCKQASFVERHMKMRVLISNTFWRSAVTSPSKELPKMLYYFTPSHSRYWERQNNGSMPTIEILHGITAPLPS